MLANIEATPFYAAGADICTVLGVSGMATIAGVIKAANAYHAEAQIDLINVPDKLECAKEAAKIRRTYHRRTYRA